MTTDGGTFNPAEHIVKLRGKDYLEVKWRLVWFRDRHPEGSIVTEIMEHDRQAKFALVRATVSTPGGGSATGYKQEEAKDFPDYIEKAETGAIGRALAALGFGTQFAEDFEDGEKRGELAVKDTPVDRNPPSPPLRAIGSDRHRFTGSGEGPQGVGPNEGQIRAIYAIGRGTLDLSDEDIHAELHTTFGVDSLHKLSSRQASEFIDALKEAGKRRAMAGAT